MKGVGKNIIVKQPDDTNKVEGVLITESHVSASRNCGKVLWSPKDSEIKEGTFVHFSDMSGVYTSKTDYPNVMTIGIDQIIAVTETDDKRVETGEDLRFYLLNHIGAASRTKGVHH